jgi:hypothetical protein
MCVRVIFLLKKSRRLLCVSPQGSAFVRTKLKNLISGNSNDKTWRAGESASCCTDN